MLCMAMAKSTSLKGSSRIHASFHLSQPCTGQDELLKALHSLREQPYYSFWDYFAPRAVIRHHLRATIVARAIPEQKLSKERCLEGSLGTIIGPTLPLQNRSPVWFTTDRSRTSHGGKSFVFAVNVFLVPIRP